MKKVAVFDCETEPFDGKRLEYRPFAIGFYDGVQYRRFWGKNCIADFLRFLRDYPEPLLIYAHNGGKFDFLFFMPYLNPELLIINNRITKATLYHHELRDSFSIVPEALERFHGEHSKIKINYDWFLPGIRERHKEEICDYLRADIMTLYEGVQFFRQDFGNALTIGLAALTKFRNFYDFDCIEEKDDTFFRQFYFGGRCQCFKVGVFHGDFKIYDVNSMYAAVMKNYKHPTSAAYEKTNKLTKRTTFAVVEGENFGAFPVRTKEGLKFDQPSGIFYVGIHELNLALDLGLFKLKKLHYAVEHKRVESFGQFVDWVTDRKIAMEKSGQQMRRDNYKRVGNSFYGKTAQSPANYKDHIICDIADIPPAPWACAMVSDGYAVYEKPSTRKNYNNVAIGASITSAARAVLLQGLSAAQNPLYCDTDSIICEGFKGDIAPYKLGAWKLEASGNEISIAGKKSYVLRNGGLDIKLACKGIPRKTVGISNIISSLAKDESASFNVANPVPHFSLSPKASYISRRIRQTGKPAARGQIPSQASITHRQSR